MMLVKADFNNPPFPRSTKALREQGFCRIVQLQHLAKRSLSTKNKYQKFTFPSSKSGGGALEMTNFAVGATGSYLGAFEQGWKLSSNKSQWNSARQIQQSLKSSGINVKTSTIKNGIPKGLKTTGKVLGFVGVGLTAYDALSDGNLILGEGVKIGIGIVTIYSPVGWAYGVVDVGVQAYSGTSLTDRIGNAIDDY